SFVLFVALFKLGAIELVEVGDIRGRKKCPWSVFLEALHKKVGDPGGGVEVVCATSLVAGVFTQLYEVFDIEVPVLEVHGRGTPPATRAIYRNGDVVGNFEERYDALA